MKFNPKLVECLFGHHDYSEELTGSKDGDFVHLCKVCGRAAYRRFWTGVECWYRYDEKGNCIHMKFSSGHEYRFDDHLRL